MSVPGKLAFAHAWLSVHRVLYIFFIRLNPTNSQGMWLKASCFPPATGCWWLLALSVLVFRCWCSCGGDENNLSTGIDNAEITSRPSRVSPVEMVPKTAPVCLYCSETIVSKWAAESALRMSPGWDRWEESWDEPVHLPGCVNAKGISLLRCALQHSFHSFQFERLFLVDCTCTISLLWCPFPNTFSYSKFSDIISCCGFFFLDHYLCIIFL